METKREALTYLWNHKPVCSDHVPGVDPSKALKECERLGVWITYGQKAHYLFDPETSKAYVWYVKANALRDWGRMDYDRFKEIVDNNVINGV